MCAICEREGSCGVAKDLLENEDNKPLPLLASFADVKILAYVLCRRDQVPETGDSILFFFRGEEALDF